MHWPYLASDNDATTTSLNDQCSGLYLYFYKLYNHHAWEFGRPGHALTLISKLCWRYHH